MKTYIYVEPVYFDYRLSYEEAERQCEMGIGITSSDSKKNMIPVNSWCLNRCVLESKPNCIEWIKGKQKRREILHCKSCRFRKGTGCPVIYEAFAVIPNKRRDKVSFGAQIGGNKRAEYMKTQKRERNHERE